MHRVRLDYAVASCLGLYSSARFVRSSNTGSSTSFSSTSAIESEMRPESCSVAPVGSARSARAPAVTRSRRMPSASCQWCQNILQTRASARLASRNQDASAASDRQITHRSWPGRFRRHGPSHKLTTRKDRGALDEVVQLDEDARGGVRSHAGRHIRRRRNSLELDAPDIERVLETEERQANAERSAKANVPRRTKHSDAAPSALPH